MATKEDREKAIAASKAQKAKNMRYCANLDKPNKMKAMICISHLLSEDEAAKLKAEFSKSLPAWLDGKYVTESTVTEEEKKSANYKECRGGTVEVVVKPAEDEHKGLAHLTVVLTESAPKYERIKEGEHKGRWDHSKVVADAVTKERVIGTAGEIARLGPKYLSTLISRALAPAEEPAA